MSHRTVLVAHAAPDYLERLVPRLSDLDLHVIGPVQTARMALALAAQHGPEMALIGPELCGERDGAALAAALESRWGVPSRILEEEDPGAVQL